MEFFSKNVGRHRQTLLRHSAFTSVHWDRGRHGVPRKPFGSTRYIRKHTKLSVQRTAAIDTRAQRRRHDLKYGGQGQSGRGIKLFQAPRKISFTFHYKVFHPPWRETCSAIQQQFWVKVCDILGGKNILWPSYIFSAGQDCLIIRNA